MDEKGTDNPLKKYSKKTLLLTIPPEVRGQPIQYFGVWSPSKGMLASVTFDPEAYIPPSVKSLVQVLFLWMEWRTEEVEEGEVVEKEEVKEEEEEEE